MIFHAQRLIKTIAAKTAIIAKIDFMMFGFGLFELFVKYSKYMLIIKQL